MENLNINLSEARKKRYTIDGDENRILEFDATDLGLLVRIEEVEPAILDAVNKFGEAQADADYENNETIKEMAKRLKELDLFIRERLDYLFDTNFSEVCAPHGTMLDPVNGEMRFTYLLDTFANVYGEELSKALKKRNDTMKKYTKKYVKNAK